MGDSPLWPISEFRSSYRTFQSAPFRQDCPNLAASLCQSPLFRGLDNASVDLLLNAALPRHFLSGQFLCHQGEPATNLHVITNGVAKVYGTTHAGDDAIFDWCRQGDVVGVGAIVS